MRLLLIIAFFTSLESCTAHVSKMGVKPTKEDLLGLPYVKFDQTPGEGWRALAESLGNYFEAAKLIDKYIVNNLNTLDFYQLRILNWHAGQMYAFSNDINEARQRFIESIDEQESKDSPILWNDYVGATIAFLDKNWHRLKKHRKAILEGPKFNGITTNLDVVDRLIKCFDKTYQEAYLQCNQ